MTTRFGVQSRDVKSAEIVKVEKMIMSENDNVKNDISKMIYPFYFTTLPYRTVSRLGRSEHPMIISEISFDFVPHILGYKPYVTHVTHFGVTPLHHDDFPCSMSLPL